MADEALGAGRSVLDVGAGNGLASWPWHSRGLNVTAVDSSAEMLGLYAERDPAVETVVADVADWLACCDRRFDLVAHVSMLHHVPDYLGLVDNTANLVGSGGSLLTFQDPLLYARMRRIDHAAEQAMYFSWRVFQGAFRRGFATRMRRMRGVYSDADYDEYHVVRGGLDAEAIADLLGDRFEAVRVVRYWSTQGRIQQKLGNRCGLASNFAIIATNRSSS